MMAKRQHLRGVCLKTYRPSCLLYQECVQFFQIIGKLIEATLIKLSLVTLHFVIYRVTTLTDLATVLIKNKITNITN